MKFFKTLDKLLTITGTIYLERKPASCQNFDEKQWLSTFFLFILKKSV